ncbi:hypothetical protein MNBD_GAMMA06-1572 [hydrothermal vent metagenome]|uniref:Uncharacterized protein n=1 Tax=hydrothermal vent metagenome TaxID=652676 RepID=A0A3B0WM47_9ZZZZ
MTLEKAHELIAMHADFGSGYNQHAAKMVLGEVMRDFGQETVDALIREYKLEDQWGIKPGTEFKSAFKS